MKQMAAVVREDLKILVLEIEVDPAGTNHLTREQHEEIKRFRGKKSWEWMYWVVKGTSQGSHGEPLKEPFLSLHKAIRQANKENVEAGVPVA